ncbi:hypothetical protein B0T24DRAFT_93920 [Lasiosphaeria ovina]|uniref:Secreted protein n=1 Tax=Lasiosphaeria ovina TaxID=92902 RepID=A0AAE0NN70_9PEZI|nr:hypothetical protein B0T24DRAFT_93920 [Lasiosphaeria ovina]
MDGWQEGQSRCCCRCCCLLAPLLLFHFRQGIATLPGSVPSWKGGAVQSVHTLSRDRQDTREGRRKKRKGLSCSVRKPAPRYRYFRTQPSGVPEIIWQEQKRATGPRCWDQKDRSDCWGREKKTWALALGGVFRPTGKAVPCLSPSACLSGTQQTRWPTTLFF